MAPDEHLLVQPGDIAYNMMRMWQGAFGLAEIEGIVSPAYVVLKPKIRIDSRYASQLFKTKRLIHLFWAYSHGITDDRLRLYFADFARIPVTIPPLEQQKKIANVLATWDRAVSDAENLYLREAVLYDQMMRSLTTGIRRLEGYRGEWRTVSLAEIGSTFGGLTGKTIEHFGQGKPYIPYKTIFGNGRIDLEKLDYVNIESNENQNKCQFGDIFLTSSSETPDELGTASVLLDEVNELYLNSFSVGFRLKNFERLLPEFAQFLLRGPKFRRSLIRLAQGYTRYNLSKHALLKVKLSLPNLDEQKAIADALSVTEKKLTLLRRNINSLKVERLAISQRLLLVKRNESAALSR